MALREDPSPPSEPTRLEIETAVRACCGLVGAAFAVIGLAAGHFWLGLAGLAGLAAAAAWDALAGRRALQRQSERLSAAEQRAADAEQERKRFFTIVSEHLRTPINAALGANELLRRAELNAAERNHLAPLAEAAEVLVATLNDIIDYGRIAANSVRIETAPADPGALTQALAAAWRVRAEDKWLEIFVDVDATTPPLAEIDSVRVRQILHTLMGFSIKRTQHGGVRLSVCAAAGEAGPLLHFTIRDTGPDCPREEWQALLEGGGAGAEFKAGAGLNLDLALCRRLAKAMGGELAAASKPGRGTTFTLIIPMQILAETKNPEREGRLRALVAEDHAVSRRIIASMLEKLGFEVAAVADGAAGLAALQMRRFDLVLLDLEMPVLHGLEVARRIRSEGGPNRFAPILALTASSMPQDLARCRESGMDGHLAKPIDPNLLAREVERILIQSGRSLAA